MKRIITSALIALLTGCSSNIVKMEKDTYMVSEKAAGCGFATSSGQEAIAYTKANEFCSNKGLEVETIESTLQNGIPFVRCANASLKFKCAK